MPSYWDANGNLVDGLMEVRLTKSNEKIAEVANVSVTAGSAVQVIASKNITNYSRVYAVTRANDASAFTMLIGRLGFAAGASGTESRGNIASVTGSSGIAISGFKDADSPMTAVTISNTDVINHTYDVFLGGIK